MTIRQSISRMRDMDEALSWLTWESGSKLSNNSRFWINRFNIPTLENLEREEIVQALERLGEGVRDDFEQAEVLTYCGYFHYYLSHYAEAESSFTQANNLYENLEMLHCHAVTTWMLYLVQRAQREFRKAFDDGRRSRGHFKQKSVQYRQLGNAVAEGWYQDRALDLTAYLIQTPEDMFGWLFEFHGSRLNATALQYRDSILGKVERREFGQAKDEIDMLLEITRQPIECQESAEAFTICGVAEWLMDQQMDQHMSLYYFRLALTQYLPASHEYAVLTWMLGLAQFAIPAMRGKAIVRLESAIERFDRLSQKALMANDPIQQEWYTLHHDAMRRVLRTMTT